MDTIQEKHGYRCIDDASYFVVWIELRHGVQWLEQRSLRLDAFFVDRGGRASTAQRTKMVQTGWFGAGRVPCGFIGGPRASDGVCCTLHTPSVWQ